MKQFNRFLTLVMAPMLLGFGLTVAIDGCKTVANQPLAPAAKDAVDDNANRILETAHSFAKTVSDARTSTDPAVHIDLTAAQDNVLIILNKSLNAADALEQGYHALPSTDSATKLTAATQTVEQNLASAQSIIPAVTPAVKK